MMIKSILQDIQIFSKKKIFSVKRIFVIFSLLFVIFPLVAQEAEITTITINNARQTSYKKNEETGNDTIVLEGGVELQVQKSSSTTTVKADKVTFDRKSQMLYAEGSVEILTKNSSGQDTTTANSLLMNTSTLEGVFDGGRVVQSQTSSLNLPSGSTLIVLSEQFGKSSNNVVAFKNSSLTFCNDENPHWHIDASRTWLLPGGEFAFLNALLYVGSLPVLYLPAFYYPKDELIFNPVFNYRRREGYSIQTTTYLWGRKPLDTSSSTDTTVSGSLSGIYNFIKPSTLKEQKLEGLVLHNLDQDYTGDTSQYAKLMVDWYSNLGYMVGFDSSFKPKNKYLTSFAFGVDLGFSNTLFPKDNLYYPFSSTGQTYEDSATFLGFTTPFRYSANLKVTLSKPFTLNLSLPIYSDPYYAYDFKTYRKESMDWLTYLMENTSTSTSTDTITVSEVSSFTWQLTSSYSPTLPTFIKPYVSSASINWNSTINFSSLSANTSEMTYNGSETVESEWLSNTPTRKFYYPSLVTPVSTTLSVSGTLFSWPMTSNSSSKKTSYSFPVAINKPDELKSEKQLKEEAEAAEKEAQKKLEEEAKSNEDVDDEEDDEDDDAEISDDASTADETENEDLFEYYLPSLDYSPSLTSITQGFTYKLSYSASANIVDQFSYSSSNLKKSEDFEWDTLRSKMYTIKTPVSLTSTMNYGGSFLSVTNGLTYSPVWQKHHYISDDETIGYTKSAADTLRLSDYNAEKQDIANTNTISFKPFAYVDMFSDSSVSWNSTIKVLRREFIGDVDNPEYEIYGVDWTDDDSITVNSLSAVLSAKEFNKKFGQTLTFTAIMPPLLRQYTATLALTFPYVTASVSTGVQENSDKNLTAKQLLEFQQWKKNPLQQSLSISFPLLGKNLTLSESYTYNREDEEHESLKASLSWNSFSISYVMSNTIGYDFENGWIAREEKEFLPYSLSFSYAPSTKTYYRWFNRISFAPGLNFSVSADLLRATNSYLLFSPSLTFKLNEFLTFTFSSTSRNSVLYWYFHNEEGDLYSEWGGFPGNIIKDLCDSFRFDDQSLREKSGFKLKSFNMTLAHELHDWTFNMTMKIEPRVVTENGSKYYDFSPYITIGVVWNPMDSMKTSIIDEYGEWSVE